MFRRRERHGPRRGAVLGADADRDEVAVHAARVVDGEVRGRRVEVGIRPMPDDLVGVASEGDEGSLLPRGCAWRRTERSQ